MFVIACNQGFIQMEWYLSASVERTGLFTSVIIGQYFWNPSFPWSLFVKDWLGFNGWKLIYHDIIFVNEQENLDENSYQA